MFAHTATIEGEEWTLVASIVKKGRIICELIKWAHNSRLDSRCLKANYAGKRDVCEREFLLHSDELVSDLSLFGLQFSEKGCQGCVQDIWNNQAISVVPSIYPIQGSGIACAESRQGCPGVLDRYCNETWMILIAASCR